MKNETLIIFFQIIFENRGLYNKLRIVISEKMTFQQLEITFLRPQLTI